MQRTYLLNHIVADIGSDSFTDFWKLVILQTMPILRYQPTQRCTLGEGRCRRWYFETKIPADGNRQEYCGKPAVTTYGLCGDCADEATAAVKRYHIVKNGRVGTVKERMTVAWFYRYFHTKQFIGYHDKHHRSFMDALVKYMPPVQGYLKHQLYSQEKPFIYPYHEAVMRHFLHSQQ